MSNYIMNTIDKFVINSKAYLYMYDNIIIVLKLL